MLQENIWKKLSLISAVVCIAIEASTTTSPGEEELPGIGAEHSSLESSCSLNCNCIYLQNARGIEYRASCEGNASEEIVLTDLLFDDEATPNRTTNVYVKVTNFTRVDVQSSFLSRWLAYKSCSMDIWFAAEVLFPPSSPPIGPSTHKKHVFAGLSIAFSHLQRLPVGLFQKKTEGQLWLTSVHIEELSLEKLMADSALRNLDISNSSIARFFGSEESSITLKRNGAFSIENTIINRMETGSLNFKKSRGNPPVVSLFETRIGVMDTGSIILGEGVICNMENNTLGIMLPSVFNLLQGSILRAKLNFFTVTEDSLINIYCRENSHHVEKNVVYDPKYVLCDTDPSATDERCSFDRSISMYIYPTCTGNLLAKTIEPESSTISFMILVMVLLVTICILVGVIMWLRIIQEVESNSSSIVYGDAPTTYFAAPMASAPLNPYDDYATQRARKISQTLSFGIPVSMMHNDEVYPMDDFIMRM